MDTTNLFDIELVEMIANLNERALKMEPKVDLKHFEQVASTPIPKAWFKKRDIGKTKVDYIEGARVRQLLNEACGGPIWTFIPIKREVVTDVVRYYKREAQSNDIPYFGVLGVLLIPGLGAKIGWGTKILDGGTNEQQYGWAVAITNSLKSAAKEFGIALELYIDGEYDPETWGGNSDTAIPLDQPRQFVAPQSQAKPEAEPKTWSQAEVDRLHDFREILGIAEDHLNGFEPFISDWSGGKLTSFEQITPMNVKSFNDYLEKRLVHLHDHGGE